jgi:hypothetical protein
MAYARRTVHEARCPGAPGHPGAYLTGENTPGNIPGFGMGCPNQIVSLQ